MISTLLEDSFHSRVILQKIHYEITTAAVEKYLFYQ